MCGQLDAGTLNVSTINKVRGGMGVETSAAAKACESKACEYCCKSCGLTTSERQLNYPLGKVEV